MAQGAALFNFIYKREGYLIMSKIDLEKAVAYDEAWFALYIKIPIEDLRAHPLRKLVRQEGVSQRSGYCGG